MEPMMVQQFVKLEHEDGVSILTIDRQDKLNALSAEVMVQLLDAVAVVRSRRGVRCLIVTGAGDKAFVAGADISAMRDMRLEQARAFARAGHMALDALEALPVPVIAAVNGFALGGGCELALACDFIYASEKAKFGQPEVKLGVIPGFGGTQRLLRRVGSARAKELIFTGATLSAEQALAMGLVNRVLPHAELMRAVRETAQAIAAAGPLAIAEAKRVLRDGEGRFLRDANLLEIDGFSGCFETEDQKEGMTAFLEKRTPAFKAE
jgi:enoyl-CoA hydratase